MANSAQDSAQPPSTALTSPNATGPEAGELVQARLEKLRRLREQGSDPFEHERFDRSHTCAQAVVAFAEWERGAAGQDPAPELIRARLCGRLVSRRVMGKAVFLDIRDESGRIQLYCRANVLGPDSFARLEMLDIGDFLGLHGNLFRTRMGEITLEVASFDILAKAIRPLPFGKTVGEEHHNDVADVEFRYRQRYADLAVHPEVRDHFRRRSLILRSIREFFDGRGYIEVETPVLQSVAGGASARPFNTHHNALNQGLHLRISLELYLKRLIVGGFERVYEIGRVFRNEGIDTSHNPEFTMLESYEAYVNLESIEELVEQLVASLATQLYGRPVIPHGDGEIDLTPPWPRLPVLDAIRARTGVEPEAFLSFESAHSAAERVGMDVSREVNVGGIVAQFLDKRVEPHLFQPVFITEYPVEISPLAKKIPGRPHLTRRFEAYVACSELANAFSEINDPLDQRERFLAQAALRAAGDDEAHPLDEDYLRALEYGMPPTGGLGIGIDRLVMLLTNTDSIRDVLLFPQMKPER